MRVAKFVIVLAFTVVVAMVAFYIVQERMINQALDESYVALDAVIAGKPRPELSRAWYDEPINVALIAGGITLVVGGLGAVLTDSSKRSVSS